MAEQLCDAEYGQGYLFFFAVKPFEAFAGDGFVDADDVEVEFEADCSDGTGVIVCGCICDCGCCECSCCCSSGATGRRGYCEGAIDGNAPMVFAENCDRWSGMDGAIINCCSMNGVMEVGDGKKSWRSKSPYGKVVSL